MRKPKIREIPEFLRDVRKHHKLTKQCKALLEKQKALGKEGEGLSGDDKKLFELYVTAFMISSVEALKIQQKWNM